MTGVTTVGVDDDLAAGQTGVTHGATDLEATGRVHQEPIVVGLQSELGDHRIDDVLADVRCEQLVQADVRRVLTGDDHRVQPDRGLVVVLDRHLGLAVRAQIRNRPVTANLGQTLGEGMCELDRQRHQLRGLPVGVAEHQALVARSLTIELVLFVVHTCLVGGVHSLSDVGGLGIDGNVDPARVTVEPLCGGVIPGLENFFSNEGGNVDICLGGDLTRDMDLTSGDHCLDRDPAGGVGGEHRVEDRVTDLIGHLVRMAFSDRLGGEKASGHSK